MVTTGFAHTYHSVGLRYLGGGALPLRAQHTDTFRLRGLRLIHVEHDTRISNYNTRIVTLVTRNAESHILAHILSTARAS